tara:strand:- start:85 stop:648 length:564 start_codon:yes stop_codon:yes gene_type:complete
MNNQNLIIYNFISLYKILEELDLDLNFKIIHINNENLLKNEIKKLNNYLILSNEKNSNFENQLFLDNKPVKILKLLEKINVEFLKLHFNEQSKLKINNYIIDLNSRQMVLNNVYLKLTEKEINTIAYLLKVNKPVNIDELQKQVWSYQSEMETHTVETHIYRLRKKLYDKFKDKDFIVSKKNGYEIS